MNKIEVFDLLPSEHDLFAFDVLAGLSKPLKTIAAKYFYDERGSELFEQICELDEYYLTRTETALLREHATEMAELLGDRCLLIEFGSGSGLKSKLLLGAVKGVAAYVPIDISRTALVQSARELSLEFPELQISAVCADFTVPLALPDSLCAAATRRAGFFPGSTIGNFDPKDAVDLLSRIGALLESGGRLLIGVDVLKDAAILEPAYNDAKGVTAAFNLNLLIRINRELSANFNLKQFVHHAVLNREKSRVEMHLRSRVAQNVEVAGRTFYFRTGETIHTENSYKYSTENFERLALAAGFSVVRRWSDAKGLFAVYCLEFN